MRVALFTRLPGLLDGVSSIVRACGHELAGVVTTEGPPGRYGHFPLSTLLEARPAGSDVLVADGSTRFAALLAALEPDLALCGGFPVRIPADAIAVPRLGILNGHPSPLPRYRGPNPLGWAVRNGDTELGFTFHFMDAEIDTGPILLGGSAPISPAAQPSDLIDALFGLWSSLLPEALARTESGERGTGQSDARASYAGFFDADYVELDRSRSAADVDRQVRAWAIAVRRGGVDGPLAELDGKRVVVRRTRLDDGEGGTPIVCGDGRPLWVVETSPAATPRA
jgi:methionyl-tRNA formyltransferase